MVRWRTVRFAQPEPQRPHTLTPTLPLLLLYLSLAVSWCQKEKEHLRVHVQLPNKKLKQALTGERSKGCQCHDCRGTGRAVQATGPS